MPDEPDLDELAQKYLDLWQQHMSALAKDGETAELLASTIAMMNTGAAAFAQSVAEQTRPADADADKNGADHGRGKTRAGGERGNGTVDGAAAAAPPSGHTDAVVDEFVERIAALEERVARIEDGRAKKRRTRKTP